MTAGLGGRLCVVALLAILAFVAGPRRADAAYTTWLNNQCWQTGQLGAEASACQDATASGFLSGHMIDDANGAEDFKVGASGQYCSYSGMPDTLELTSHSAAFEPIPRPANFQIESDEGNNACGVWAAPGEPAEWGLQVRNSAGGKHCEPVAVEKQGERCKMEHYVSFASQGLNDRPWAPYYTTPMLDVSGLTEPRVFEPKTGGAGWGYICPEVEDATGVILELCVSSWIGYAEHGYYSEWNYEHVVECRAPVAGFPHSVDRIEIPGRANTLDNLYGEPIESWNEHEARLPAEGGISASLMQGVAELANKPFEAKVSPSGRLDEPELGAGCGSDVNTAPAAWALIGVATGIEAWEGVQTSMTISPSTVWTEFKPHLIEISSVGAKPTGGAEAVVTASINPEGFPTKYVVEYAPEGAGSGHSAEVSIGSGTEPEYVSTRLEGLKANTHYEYRLKAFRYEHEYGETAEEEERKTTYSKWQTFTTGVPVVTSLPATAVSRTTATLNGTVNPEGSTVTECYFQYGPTEAYGSVAPCMPAPGSGPEPVSVSAAITGLHETTTYYFRIVAVNHDGTSTGEPAVFATLPQPPTATPSGATSHSSTAATLAGTVNPNGLTVSECRFEYGEESEDLHLSAPCSPAAGSGEAPVEVTASITGLSPYDTYYYRLSATNALGSTQTAERTFRTQTQCAGSNIVAAGATLQAPAEALWSVGFNTNTSSVGCSGVQGDYAKPTVEYRQSAAASGSVACLRSLGAEKATPEHEYSFCATDEAPNAEQKAEIETHKSGGEAETLETIPLTQSAVAILVHLPEGCRASSEPLAYEGKTRKLGRLVLDAATLEGLYRGTINTWKQLLEAQAHANDQLSCEKPSEEETAISRVVRTDHAGTTHILKAYLEQVDGASFKAEAYGESYEGSATGCGASFPSESKTWTQVSEGCANQRWPEAAHVVRPTEPGDVGVLNKVSATPSSVGYASLATAAQYKRYSEVGVGGEAKKGEQNARFWAPVQNSSAAGIEYADPSSKGDEEKLGEANCKNTFYRENGENEFPPSSTRKLWSEAKAATVEENYPLCGITYALASRESAPYLKGAITGQEGRERVNTVVNYLLYVLSSKGGVKEIKDHDYETLPKEVLKKAEAGVRELGFEAPSELCPPKPEPKCE